MDTIFGWLILIALIIFGAVCRGLMINWWKKQPDWLLYGAVGIWALFMIWAIATR